ncbi:hypothetical protein [Ornithobacterium rhinotracheale]|uniref:hypothetical protein n=1 Tax=Ornithobacterium rhinotracheale TaxID=28251 RepID=UPI001FF2C386|nr:hypothetical protein [Ornithobacterium rhinotracheale]MCK0204642.1 hypothetical protein [Ornithobacterium rhinotracheale]
MVIKKKDFQKRILSLIDEAYKASSNSASYMGFHRENEHIKVEIRFRVQYDNYLSFNGFSVCFRSLEKNFITLLNNELSHLYEENMVFTSKKFYPLTYKFNFREIKTELELDEYIAEFVKCLEYHEKEVFPKLLDIRFLAEYVGSVPFDKQSEISVGGKFPVHLFKKLAILKWGNQTERYEEYKENTKIRIEKYAIEKPDRYNPAFKEGFESLISHLENEPNPFL